MGEARHRAELQAERRSLDRLLQALADLGQHVDIVVRPSTPEVPAGIRVAARHAPRDLQSCFRTLLRFRMRPRFESRQLSCGVMLAFVVLLGGGLARAQSTQNPEQVVHAHATAWGEGDLSRLLALFADDARGFDRSSDPHILTGRLSDTIGSKDRLASYYKAASAKPPLSQESVVESATVGELVIASGESFTPPNGARMSFLTAYRVRAGRIHNLWHLAWTRADAPVGGESLAAIEELVAARNARDVGRVRVMFGPGARHFRYSDNPHALADTPSDTVVDDTGLNIRTVKAFAVGDLAVVQSHTSGDAGALAETVNSVSIYRVQDGRIAAAWLIGEEALAAPQVPPEPDAEKAVREYLSALNARHIDRVAAVVAPQLAMHHAPPRRTPSLAGELMRCTRARTY